MLAGGPLPKVSRRRTLDATTNYHYTIFRSSLLFQYHTRSLVFYARFWNSHQKRKHVLCTLTSRFKIISLGTCCQESWFQSGSIGRLWQRTMSIPPSVRIHRRYSCHCKSQSVQQDAFENRKVMMKDIKSPDHCGSIQVWSFG